MIDKKEYITIMQRQKRNILSVGYIQGCVFKRFKGCIKFLDKVKQLGISMSTIGFKMNLITGFRGLKNF